METRGIDMAKALEDQGFQGFVPLIKSDVPFSTITSDLISRWRVLAISRFARSGCLRDGSSGVAIHSLGQQDRDNGSAEYKPHTYGYASRVLPKVPHPQACNSFGRATDGFRDVLALYP